MRSRHAAPLLVALALSACGSSVAGGASTTGSNDNAGLVFSKCMRSHGLTHFPDPGASSGSDGSASQISVLGVRIPSTIDVHSPAFKSALKLCMNKATGGHPPPPLTAAQRRAAIDFSRCMRQHGVPNFPDPVFKNGRIGLGLPAGISPNSPALARAQKACGNP